MLMVSKIWPSSMVSIIYDSGRKFLAWENQHWIAQGMDINKKTEKPSKWKKGQSMNEQNVNEDTQTPVSPGEQTGILSIDIQYWQKSGETASTHTEVQGISQDFPSSHLLLFPNFHNKSVTFTI